MTKRLEVGEQTAIVVRKTVAMAGMGAAQQQARPLLDMALRIAGQSQPGPRLTVWRAPRDCAIDYAPGVLVASPIAVEGDVSLFTLPAGDVAHLRVEGGYETLPATWVAWSAIARPKVGRRPISTGKYMPSPVRRR